MQGYEEIIKEISSTSCTGQEEQKAEKKKENENKLKITLRENCLKKYEELLKAMEEEENKGNLSKCKKYRMKDKQIEGFLTYSSVVFYYVKACIRLGDVERGIAVLVKLEKEFKIESPAFIYCVILRKT